MQYCVICPKINLLPIKILHSNLRDFIFSKPNIEDDD